jgi:hypothetical protein
MSLVINHPLSPSKAFFMVAAHLGWMKPEHPCVMALDEKLMKAFEKKKFTE